MRRRGSAEAHRAAQLLELLRGAVRGAHHPSPSRVLEACAAALRVAVRARPEDTLAACLARLPLLPRQLPALAADPPGGAPRDVALLPVARLTAAAAGGALVAEALPADGAPPLVVIVGRTVGLLEWAGCRNPDNLFAVGDAPAALGDGARARHDRGRPCALSPLRAAQELPGADGECVLRTDARHVIVHEGVDEAGLVATWLVLARRALPDADLHVHRRALTAYAPLSSAQVGRALAHCGHLLALAPAWARGRRPLVEAALRTAPTSIRHAAAALRRAPPARWWRRAGPVEVRLLLRRRLTDDAARLVAAHALAAPLDPDWAWPAAAWGGGGGGGGR